MSSDTGSRLKALGVPKYIHSKTLVAEKLQEVRDWIISEGFMDEAGGMIGLRFCLANQSKGSMTALRTAFLVTAKEFFLYKVPIKVVDLMDIAEAVDNYAVKDLFSSGKTYLFINGFYEPGAECPLTPKQAHVIRSILFKHVSRGGGLCTMTSGDPNNAFNWWTDDFVRFLAEHTKTIKIN